MRILRMSECNRCVSYIISNFLREKKWKGFERIRYGLVLVLLVLEVLGELALEYFLAVEWVEFGRS
jgi:hypothetical protein